MGSFRQRRRAADGTFPHFRAANAVSHWVRLGSFRRAPVASHTRYVVVIVAYSLVKEPSSDTGRADGGSPLAQASFAPPLHAGRAWPPRLSLASSRQFPFPGGMNRIRLPHSYTVARCRTSRRMSVE